MTSQQLHYCNDPMSGVGPPPGHHHRGHHRGRPLPLPALSVSCLGLTVLTSSCLHRLSHFWLLGITSSVFGLVTGLWVSAMPPALISLLGIRGNIIITSSLSCMIITLRSGHGVWPPDPD